MELVILTGVSGAGKSTVVQAFEEMDYSIVENVPVNVVNDTITAFLSDQIKYAKTVLVVSLDMALETLKIAKKYNAIKPFFIALDANKQEILTRYKLTRHVHPLQAKGMSLEQAITSDRKAIEKVRPYTDLFIDTTGFTPTELRKKIFINIRGKEKDLLTVTFISFGYKHGTPNDVEIVLDTRILDNPYWVPTLKELTGKDKPVQDYVMKSQHSEELLQRIETFLDFYLNIVKLQGRNFYTIGIGCSGGKHRSVTIAEMLAERYAKKYEVLLIHRDAERFKQ
jgi:UPF0042 nucleotide-binding protein